MTCAAALVRVVVLAAALFTGTVVAQSSPRIKDIGAKYTAGLDETTVMHLRNVAWEAAREYYGR